MTSKSPMNLSGSQRCQDCLIGMVVVYLWPNCWENHLKLTVLCICHFFSFKKYMPSKCRGVEGLTSCNWRCTGHLNLELDLQVCFEETKLSWNPNGHCLCITQTCLQLPLLSFYPQAPIGTTDCGICGEQEALLASMLGHSTFSGTEADAMRKLAPTCIPSWLERFRECCWTLATPGYCLCHGRWLLAPSSRVDEAVVVLQALHPKKETARKLAAVPAASS